jgi:tRNA nucleotidyltransferase/poly(A) polymerase
VNENTEIDIATSCPVQKIPAVFKDYKHEYVGMAFGVCIVKIKGFAEEEFIEEILACGDDGLGNPISKYSKETKKRKKYVYFSYDIATFRRDGVYLDGRKPNGIEIKSVSVEEDAKRRDFTINALYYDPVGVCRCLTASDNVRYDHDCGV